MIFISLIVYSTLIGSLIWARFSFFRISSKETRLSSKMYDPVVIIHVLAAYYGFYTSTSQPMWEAAFSILLYFCSIVLFWQGIFTSKKLDFAFSSDVGEIITKGPFGVVRHPFYSSYILCWLASTLLFNSFLLWITLAYLITFYFMSARREEKAIVKSVYAAEYMQYKKDVGMFLPRVTQWKGWLLKASHQRMR